jgi:hypothetical protein
MRNWLSEHKAAASSGASVADLRQKLLETLAASLSAAVDLGNLTQTPRMKAATAEIETLTPLEFCKRYKLTFELFPSTKGLPAMLDAVRELFYGDFLAFARSLHAYSEICDKKVLTTSGAGSLANHRIQFATAAAFTHHMQPPSEGADLPAIGELDWLLY